MTAIGPIQKFQALWARAHENAPFDAAAVSLATAGATGRPAARMVLLRGANERGFFFYTNYQSRKGTDLAANPQAALCCYWPWLDEQVRIEGRVEKATEAESDTYFAGRPRGSQIGAWASDQSRPLDDRATLEKRYEELEARFANQPVSRPPHWGGYRIIPDRIEFWHAHTNRLHDRLVFTRSSEGAVWQTETLYP